MKVSFCDLCSQPIKGIKWILSIVSEEELNYIQQKPFGLNQQQFNTINKEKEICDNCKTLMDKIFDGRFEKMVLMMNELEKTYKLPTKNPPKRKKNK
jgi:hypothetical protein